MHPRVKRQGGSEAVGQHAPSVISLPAEDPRFPEVRQSSRVLLGFPLCSPLERSRPGDLRRAARFFLKKLSCPVGAAGKNVAGRREVGFLRGSLPKGRKNDLGRFVRDLQTRKKQGG